MAVRDELQEALKGAMREGNGLARDTLRMTLSALKNREIELGRELSEDDALAVVAKGVKTRLESARQYADAGRDDLASKEKAEAELLQAYLPRQLDEAETRELVQGVIEREDLSSRKDLGRVMKAVMATHRGQVDSKLVQRLAAELLA